MYLNISLHMKFDVTKWIHVLHRNFRENLYIDGAMNLSHHPRFTNAISCSYCHGHSYSLYNVFQKEFLPSNSSWLFFLMSVEHKLCLLYNVFQWQICILAIPVRSQHKQRWRSQQYKKLYNIICLANVKLHWNSPKNSLELIWIATNSDEQ